MSHRCILVIYINKKRTCAQTNGIELNIKASDTWNFFQAKTIRQTTLRTAAEALEVDIAGRPEDAAKAEIACGSENVSPELTWVAWLATASMVFRIAPAFAYPPTFRLFYRTDT